MANESEKDTKNQSEELYTWIAKLSLSRPTKNLTRDFADAVMMAEVLKVYYPRYVDLHNYMPANSLTAKKENWSVLNRKVLSKIDMKLSKDVVHQIANCHPGAAEQLLLELRKKLPKDSEHHDSSEVLYSKEEDSIENEGREEPITPDLETERTLSCPTDESTVETLRSKKSIFAHVSRRLYFTLMWLISWVCIWKYFLNANFQLETCFQNSTNEDAVASGTQNTSENINEEESVPTRVIALLKQELREKEDIICTLNYKVAYLESAMKLKDQRISNLTTQILQNTVESEQLLKTNVAQIKPLTQSQNFQEK